MKNCCVIQLLPSDLLSLLQHQLSTPASPTRPVAVCQLVEKEVVNTKRTFVLNCLYFSKLILVFNQVRFSTLYRNKLGPELLY